MAFNLFLKPAALLPHNLFIGHKQTGRQKQKIYICLAYFQGHLEKKPAFKWECYKQMLMGGF